MPKDPIDYGRLCGAIQRSRLVLRHYRANRVKMVREQVGRHWSQEASPVDVPFNMISMYVRVMSSLLVPKNPRVMLSVEDKTKVTEVSAMQDWCNSEIIETKMATTLKRAAVDALYLIGIVKVGLAKPSDSALKAWNLPSGTPFADVVDFDDFVYDIHARDLSEAAFIGHRIRVPRDTIIGSKLYRRGRNDMATDDDPIYNSEGDLRLSALGRTTLAGSDTEEFEPMVSLWEIYLPRHRRIITMHDDAIMGASSDTIDMKPLRNERYIGPDSGPYHFLGFQTVPDNALPAAPIPATLYDIHMALNNVWRKTIRQCERAKQIAAVQGTADADGNRIMNANDGEMIRVDNPEKIAQLAFGGPTQELVAIATVLKDAFSWFSGNLESLAGLGPQAKTATQDEMLGQSASRGVSDMQEDMLNFTSGICESLLWYWWNDPHRVVTTKHSIPGMPSIQINRQIHPWGAQVRPGVDANGTSHFLRSASFRALKLKIDPYSMQHQTPQSRLALLNNVIQQIIMPALPVYAQQGIGIDLNTYLDKVAEYGDMPDLPEIVSISPPPQPEEAAPAGDNAPRMPQSTTRNYVRENRSERTNQASNKELVNTLMSGNASQNGSYEQ